MAVAHRLRRARHLDLDGTTEAFPSMGLRHDFPPCRRRKVDLRARCQCVPRRSQRCRRAGQRVTLPRQAESLRRRDRPAAGCSGRRMLAPLQASERAVRRVLRRDGSGLLQLPQPLPDARRTVAAVQALGDALLQPPEVAVVDAAGLELRDGAVQVLRHRAPLAGRRRQRLDDDVLGEVRQEQWVRALADDASARTGPSRVCAVAQRMCGLSQRIGCSRRKTAPTFVASAPAAGGTHPAARAAALEAEHQPRPLRRAAVDADPADAERSPPAVQRAEPLLDWSNPGSQISEP